MINKTTRNDNIVLARIQELEQRIDSINELGQFGMGICEYNEHQDILEDYESELLELKAKINLK